MDTIEIAFGTQDSQLLDMIRKRCESRGVSPADYFKSLAKADLAWGRFSRRKNRDEGVK